MLCYVVLNYIICTYSGLLFFSLVSLLSVHGRVHHQLAVLLKLTECSALHGVEEEGWPKHLEMSQN